MAAKIGILGESTVVTYDTTTTVYLVGTDKAARVRILFAVEGPNSNSDYTVMVGTPGSEKTFMFPMAANQDLWTGLLQESSPNPALALPSIINGVHTLVGAFDLDSDVALERIVIEPLATDYFLSAGDTVRFRYEDDGGAADLVDHLIQVIGVEDDA